MKQYLYGLLIERGFGPFDRVMTAIYNNRNCINVFLILKGEENMDAPGPERYIVPLILMFVILCFEVFIYLFKAALNVLPDSEAALLLEHSQKSVRRLIERKEEVFLASSFGSILLTVLFAYLATDTFSPLLLNLLAERAGLPAVLAQILIALIITLCSAFLLMTVAGIVPRRIGWKRPKGVVTKLAAPVNLFYTILIPAVRCAIWLSNGMMNLFGFEKMKEEESVTEAEILSMLDQGGENGAIEEGQRAMINNIFAFDDVTVSDLMTHRTDVCGIEAEASLIDLRDLAMEEGYSRIPVYEDRMDNIVGIAYIKDLLSYVDNEVSKHRTVKDMMREAMFVPETMRCDKLFRSMTEKRVQMAVVVDEYGGTAGIITLEDLLEAIVGNIVDEYDNEEEDILKVSEDVFHMDGTTDVEEVEETLHLELPEGDYDTLGGFIIELLGYIPEDGSTVAVDFNGFRFTASEIDDRRIGKIVAERLPCV